MTTLLPKVNSETLPGLLDWAKRIIVFFERDTDTGATILVAVSKTSDPAAVDLDPGHYGVFKNTTSGNVYLAYNDAGAIKKVQLT